MNNTVITLKSPDSALRAIHRPSCIVGLLGNLLPEQDRKICMTMVGETLLEAEALMIAAYDWLSDDRKSFEEPAK